MVQLRKSVEAGPIRPTRAGPGRVSRIADGVVLRLLLTDRVGAGTGVCDATQDGYSVSVTNQQVKRFGELRNALAVSRPHGTEC